MLSKLGTALDVARVGPDGGEWRERHRVADRVPGWLTMSFVDEGVEAPVVAERTSGAGVFLAESGNGCRGRGRSGARSTSTRTTRQAAAASSAPRRLATARHLPDVHGREQSDDGEPAKRKELKQPVDDWGRDPRRSW